MVDTTHVTSFANNLYTDTNFIINSINKNVDTRCVSGSYKFFARAMSVELEECLAVVWLDQRHYSGR